MSRLPTSPVLLRPTGDDKEDFRAHIAVLEQRIRQMTVQLNMLSESRVTARYNATTAQPVAGIYAKGDFVPNSTPSEQGTTSAKYVVAGWLFIQDGTASAASSVECRALTGN